MGAGLEDSFRIPGAFEAFAVVPRFPVDDSLRLVAVISLINNVAGREIYFFQTVVKFFNY